MNLERLTLGERIVMIARIAAAEHIRQETSEAGVDLSRIQSLLREAKMKPESKLAPGTFNSAERIKRGPQEAA